MASIIYLLMFLYGQVGLTLATETDCFKLSSDIVFAIDSSFSINSDDFQRQLSFIKAMVDKFTIGQNHFRVAVVSFSTTFRPDIKLNSFTNSRDLKEAVGKIKQINKGTHTQEAIHYIHTNMYESENGGRSWAKKQMVLITDGLSSNSSATIFEASVARSKGIEIFSILVGDSTDDFEIRAVASDPKVNHVFKVGDYKALTDIEKTLSSAACHTRPVISPGGTDKDGDNSETSTGSTACESRVADVIFLMDSSSSIWNPDFQKQIKFIQQVTSSFDIGKNAIRVGVIAYSDAPVTVIDLTDEQTHDYINLSLANAPHITGGTDTALAIKQARKQFSAYSYSRSNAAQVLIILSDGQSNSLEKTIAEANLARAENVYIFAIGIGDKTEDSELMELASDPDDQFVFRVNDFKALSEIKELVAVKACDVSSAGTQSDQAYEACPSIPTDVMFIYDTTALNRHHHDYVISVITEITKSSILNNDTLRVGVMRQAPSNTGSVLPDIDLTNEWTQSNFKTQLDPHSRKTSVHLLFRRVRQNYFQSTLQFNYITHRRTMVLFLDSLLEDTYSATIEAIRLRRSHVNIVVVTLGKQISRMEVVGLATTPHEVYVIDTPNVHESSVQGVVSKLLTVLCEPDQSNA